MLLTLLLCVVNPKIVFAATWTVLLSSNAAVQWPADVRKNVTYLEISLAYVATCTELATETNVVVRHGLSLRSVVYSQSVSTFGID